MSLRRLARRWSCVEYRPYLARGILAWGGGLVLVVVCLSAVLMSYAMGYSPLFALWVLRTMAAAHVFAAGAALLLGSAWVMFWTWDGHDHHVLLDDFSEPEKEKDE